MTLTTPINPIYYDGKRYFNLSLIWCIQRDANESTLIVNGIELGYSDYTNYCKLVEKWCEFLGYVYDYGQQPIRWTADHRDELNRKQMRNKLLEDAYKNRFEDKKGQTSEN